MPESASAHAQLNRFHLAIPVKDLESTRQFYVQALGCTPGRESTRWQDFDFFGHQLSAHVAPAACVESRTTQLNGHVDGESVPLRHFGLILDLQQWRALVQRLQAKDIEFLVPPTVRFAGKSGEQATLFVTDPSGNALEFKAFAEPTDVFV